MRGSSRSDQAAAGAASEATGRWTDEEHGAFLRGIDLYGRDWKKVSKLIKTRTIVQVRTHAQKFFLKEARSNPEEPGGPSQLRLPDRRLRDTPLLQPFLDQFRQDDPEAVPRLRDFLSPTLLSSDGQEVATDGPSLSVDSDESADVQRRLLNSVQPPDWYRYGRSLASLLAEAESLDWSGSSHSHTSSSRSPSPPLAMSAPRPSPTGPDHSPGADTADTASRVMDLEAEIVDGLLDHAVLSEIMDHAPDMQGSPRQG